MRIYAIKEIELSQEDMAHVVGRTLHPDWHVEKAGKRTYRLLFRDLPIMDFIVTGGYNGIREVQTFGMNVLKIVDTGLRFPVINEMMRLAGEFDLRVQE
jgi:hypothetical protein